VLRQAYSIHTIFLRKGRDRGFFFLGHLLQIRYTTVIMHTKRYKKSLFIFRREMRLHDNTALLHACAESEKVYTTFVFDDKQVREDPNDYFSPRAFAFMVQSLQELEGDIQKVGGSLAYLQGDTARAIENFVQSEHIEAVYANEDNTPFAVQRDRILAEALEHGGVLFHLFQDYTLSPVRDIRTGGGKPYGVFTPYMKNALQHEVAKPRRFAYTNLTTPLSPHPQPSWVKEYTEHSLSISPGRAEAKKILRDVPFLEKYKHERDIPAHEGTSKLSPHLKFGTISIREIFHKVKMQPYDTHQFIAELYWRDFYQHIAYHFPQVFGSAYLPWANNITWENDKKQFSAWKKGETGVPIVDAGMRELNETGWMHNRVRMIVASYLTKNLLIDWRWGELYFAQQLIDYDPASNNGGWQWSASVGADPRPLRIFNPYTQAQKYDPSAAYIQRWVPELRDVDPELLTSGKETDFSLYAPHYPRPLVSQKESYHRARAVYKQAKDTRVK
jgi:deoxyribodipyrimidine photo-lyase